MARYRSHLAGEYRDRRPREEEEGVPIRDLDLTPPQEPCFPGLVRSVLDVEEILRELTRKSLMELTVNTVGPLGGFNNPEHRDRCWAMRQEAHIRSLQRQQALYNQEWKHDEPRRPARINRFV